MGQDAGRRKRKGRKIMIQSFIIEQTTVQRKDDVGVREHNWLPHADIEQIIQTKQDGLLSFAIRVVNGEIKDLIIMDNDKYHFS
jgi:hypothetical protein